MIIRLIAIDPRPRPGSQHDVLVYQVPEHSREAELLQELLTAAGIEWEVIHSASPTRRRKK